VPNLTDTKTTNPSRGRGIPRGVILGVAIIAAVLVMADASACPTCKDAVNTSDVDGLNVARGYFYSILLMLGMPLTLASSFGLYVWREVRRARLQSDPDRASTAAALPPPDPPRGGLS